MKLNNQEFSLFIKTLREMKEFSDNLCRVLGVREVKLDEHLSNMFVLLVRMCGYEKDPEVDDPMIKYIFNREGNEEDIYKAICEELENE